MEIWNSTRHRDTLRAAVLLYNKNMPLSYVRQKTKHIFGKSQKFISDLMNQFSLLSTESYINNFLIIIHNLSHSQYFQTAYQQSKDYDLYY